MTKCSAKSTQKTGLKQAPKNPIRTEMVPIKYKCYLFVNFVYCHFDIDKPIYECIVNKSCKRSEP